MILVCKPQDKMLKEMHEKGVTRNDIEEVLKRTPIHDRIIPAIKWAYDAGYYILGPSF